MEKGEIARNKQFLLFPQCFLLNQIRVSLFVHIFDIISLFAPEFEKPKIGISGKGLEEALWEWKKMRKCPLLAFLSIFICSQKAFCRSNVLIVHAVYFSIFHSVFFPLMTHLTHSHTMTPFDAPGKQAL